MCIYKYVYIYICIIIMINNNSNNTSNNNNSNNNNHYIYICLYTYIYHRYTSIYSVERCLCSVYCCSGAVAAKRGQIIAPWLWCLHSSEARCQRCQRCCLGRPIYMLKSIEKLMWKSWTRNGSLTCYQWFARQWNCSSFTCNMCIFDICISRK